MFSVLLVLIAFSTDFAKKCKAVNYKYKVYNDKDVHGGGCPKGCFGYHNDTDNTDALWANGDEWKTDHWEKSKCVECSKINKDFIVTLFLDAYTSISRPDLAGSVNDTELEKICEGRDGATVEYTYTGGSTGLTQLINLPEEVSGCQWDSKKKKCGETSCPYMAARDNCNGNWTKGKCTKRKGDTCWAYQYVQYLSNYGSGPYNGIYEQLPSGSPCSSWFGITAPDGVRYIQVPDTDDAPDCTGGHGGWVSCNMLESFYKVVRQNASLTFDHWLPIKFTADDVKQCNYVCEHPQGGPAYPTYEYTIGDRKKCNKVYGCLYSDFQSQQRCSYWAIWAFILFLVLIILFFIAIIVVIVIIVIKLRGKKTTKVEDGAAAQSKSADPVTPVDSAPPPPSGPYVVIKLGKQEKLTKKDQSSVWGESIVFTGLGAEDDDVEFELHDNSGALLGNVNVRIPEYVNAKKRATLSLKSGEAAIGVLETDIEIQVQEEPEVKITGVFFVDKFTAV